MIYHLMRPRIIEVERRGYSLVPRSYIQEYRYTWRRICQKKTIPNTFHLCHESRAETVRYYTPPADCPGYDPPDKLFGLSSLWFDPEVDSVFIERFGGMRDDPLDLWALEGVRCLDKGVYKRDMVLAHHGEDLSNIQCLMVLDSVWETASAHDKALFPTNKPLVCYMGLFSGLKRLELQVLAPDYVDEIPKPEAVKKLTERWFKEFRELKLEIVDAEEEEKNNPRWRDAIVDTNFDYDDIEEIGVNSEGGDDDDLVVIPEVIVEVFKDG